MAPKNHAIAPPVDFSDVAEEIRRQLAAARDAQPSSEVGQLNESVLSNIMLPGQLSGGLLALADDAALQPSGVRNEAPGLSSQENQGATNGSQAASQAAARSHDGPVNTDAPAAGMDHRASGVSPAGLTESAMQPVQLAVPNSAELASSERPTTSPGTAISEPPPPPENHDPVAAAVIADQAVNEDSGFSFTLPVNSFVDVDAGDSLSYTATLADGSPLPAWLSFDAATQTFSGTPLNEDVGSLSIRVTATDTSGASAFQDFSVSVANTNDAPTASMAIANQGATEDTGFAFTVPPSSFADVDVGDSLSYAATLADGSPLPAWLSFDAATQTFSGTPLNEDVGSLSIRVTATDTSGASASQDFSVSVANTNDAPVITSSDNATLAENASGVVYQTTATDVDAGTTLTYSISGTDADLFNIDATTGAVTFKSSPNYEAPGDADGNNVYDVIVNASDGIATTAQNVTISVTNVNETPTVTSAATASFVENSTGTAYSAAATDPDAGTTLTYSISGTDASLFNIDAATGAVTFKSSPNYEAPADAGGNNVYDVKVTASDGTLSSTKDVAITVTNANEAPTVTSGATASFAENGAGTVYTATATDPDAGTTLTYSISGTDAALFNIDATTGAVTFKSSPNYEAPGDAGGNNVYDVKVTASDGSSSATKDVAITVTNANEAPVITSAATASFAERATGTVYTVAATDQDAGATLTYSLTGTDAARFNINATTGAVTFKSTPNFEAPTDAGANNVYDITVRASDGTNIASKNVAITVTNVNEAPTITSATTASFAENGTGTVYTVAATDPDAGTKLTYSLAGTDAARFNINSTTGIVTFKATPNYEAPTDSGANNVYNITVRASDGSLTASRAVAVTVNNVNEAPTVTSGATASFAENGAGTVYTATATDPDAATTLAYSISGSDAALFNINSTTGAVTFKSSPNYEAPADAGANNVYDVKVTASDGTLLSTKDVAITVTNVNEAPTVTSAATASFAENAAGTVYTAAATDPDAGTTLNYSISGTDASLFNIDASTGAVTFKSSPNYEAPTDTGGNNVYDVKVTASDGTNSTTKDVAITVTNVNEAPTVTSGATASFAENAAGTVYTATATDPDTGSTLTYSISGTDAALFNIDSATGAVTFRSSPNYEAPADAGGNNVYDVKVTASDGTLSSTQDVAITVTNVNEAPTVTSAATASFAENGAGTAYTAAATDPDAGSTLTYSISGADAALFNINSATGAVSFKASPNYEAPTDSGANNVYDVKVTASDGTLSTTKDVAITVTNINEAPVITSAATASFAENGAGTVYTATATDQDAATTLAYSISGSDAALFNIDATTGAVTFKSSPNYESPADAGGNNVYDVKVTASDGTLSSTQDVAITVTNVNEAPTAITVTGSQTVQETVVSGGTIGTAYDPGTIQPVLATLAAVDPDAGDSITYSLVGAPAGLFAISGNQITVAAGASFDYETTPSYALTVRATDSAGHTFDQAVNINISNYAASYTGTAGNDTATGTSEGDTMSGAGGSDKLYGGDGNDTLTASTGGSTLDGGNGNDVLYGGNGNDIISGGAGNDTVYASGGIDTIDGGAGSDTIIYSIGSANMTIDLSKGLGYYTSYPAGADSFSNFENAAGGSANDTLIGSSLDNILSGGAGNDTFKGGAGNDTLLGGDGADLFFLQAGLGNDTVTGGAGGGWIDALDLYDAAGNSYSGAFPSDWTLVLTSGSIISTGTETLTLSTDSSGYVQHTDGTLVNFTEIEQVRW